MDALLQKYIEKQGGKLGVLSCYEDFGTQPYYFDEKGNKLPLNVKVPPTAKLYRGNTLLDYTKSIHEQIAQMIDHKANASHRRNYPQMKIGFILRGSSPADFDGEVDTHLTLKTGEYLISPSTNLESLSEDLADKAMKIFQECSKSTLCGVTVNLSGRATTLTEFPSQSIDELYSIDENVHSKFLVENNKGDHRNNQSKINRCTALLKNIKNTIGLNGYAIQLEANLEEDHINLYQIKSFSKKIYANFKLSAVEISNYKKQKYNSFQNNDYTRIFGVTQPQGIILECFYCADHSAISSINHSDQYAAIVDKCGSYAHSHSCKNYNLSSIPYPEQGKFIGYFGNTGQVSMLHNHTRYVMESLKNNGVSCISVSLIEDLFGKTRNKKSRKLHVISDGHTMLIKKL